MARTICVAILSAVLLAHSPHAHATLFVFDATLTGPSEFPPNASPGTGTAVVDFNTVTQTMEVNVTFSGLTAGTTASHIHCCTAMAGVGVIAVATTVPTFTGFPLGVTSGTYDHIFDMTLASSYNSSFITANGGMPTTAEAALLAGILAGDSYLNIHTTAFPGGEIRGFLAQVPEPASLAILGAGLAALGIIRRRKKT